MINNYRYDIKESIIILLLGMFSPLLSLFLCLLSIHGKNLFSVYILAFLLTILIGIMPPYADNYAYYIVYKGSTDINIADWLHTQKDFLFYFIAYIFNSLELQYITFRMFLLSMEMFIFAWIFVDFTKNNIKYLEKNNFFYFLLICFLCIDIVFIAFFIRYALMASFLILGAYLFYKAKPLSAAICIFLSITTHFAALLFLPCIVLAYIFRRNFSFFNKFILMSVCVLGGTFFFSLIYNVLPEILTADTYVTGAWSGFEYKSFNGMMFYILQYYVLSSILICIYLFSKTEKNYLTRFSFFSILLFCCICTFSELSQRVWWVAKFFIVFSLLISVIRSKYKRTVTLKLYFIMAVLISSQLLSLYGLREAIFDKENIYHAINLSSFIYGEPYDDTYFFKRSIGR